MQVLNILFTSCGRRVELIRHFVNVYNTDKITGSIHCGDRQKSAPALYLEDYSVLLPPIASDEYVPFLEDYCQKHNIHLLIPLLDPELLKLALVRTQFLKINTKILISDPFIVKQAADKSLTHGFFSRARVKVPKIFSKKDDVSFPVIIKPVDGSAGKNVYKINNFRELDYYLPNNPSFLIQEFIEGDEFTVDVWFALSGEIQCIVPRKRIEVRSGEVSKGMTVKDLQIEKNIHLLAETYQGFRGCITFQCIKNNSGQIYFIEFNPRFGGGVPLAIRAGADFPRSLIYENLNLKSEKNLLDWQPDLVMLRYDQGIYVGKDEAGL